MRRNFVFFLLVVVFSSCSLLNPEPPDSGKQDYWPLAVGNTWEYERSEIATQYTPNGNNSLSGGGTIQTQVTSFKRKNDTTEIFTLIDVSNYTDIYGKRYSSEITYQIERTTNTIGSFNRTGASDTLKLHFSGLNSTYGTNAYYLKGIGSIKSEWSIFSHITAGNEIRGTGSERLIKYTLKPNVIKLSFRPR
jgi:hypothetical protein